MSWREFPNENPPHWEWGTVYMLCSDEPYEHAKHYIGWSRNLGWRLHHHRNGSSGVPLMHALKGAGIGFEVVMTVRGTHWHERQLKNRGGATRLCPRCRARARSAARNRPYTPRGLKTVTTKQRKALERQLTSRWSIVAVREGAIR